MFCTNVCLSGILGKKYKMTFSIKDFFSKCDQILNFLWIWSYLLKKSSMENFIFCAVCYKMRARERKIDTKWVCNDLLFSNWNFRVSKFWENVKYLRRSVFSKQLKVVNYFNKTLHLRHLTRFWMRLWEILSTKFTDYR